MTVAKEIEEKIELSLEEELAKLKSKKSFTKTDMDRIVEIELELKAQQYEIEKAEALNSQLNNVRGTKVLATEVVKSGEGKGITVIQH